MPVFLHQHLKLSTTLDIELRSDGVGCIIQNDDSSLYIMYIILIIDTNVLGSKSDNRYIIDIEINGNQFEKLEAAKAA